jgi:hypothetical protein
MIEIDIITHEEGHITAHRGRIGVIAMLRRQARSIGDIFEQAVVAYVDCEQKGMHDGLDETLDEGEHEEYRRYPVQCHSTKLEKTLFSSYADYWYEQ